MTPRCDPWAARGLDDGVGDADRRNPVHRLPTDPAGQAGGQPGFSSAASTCRRIAARSSAPLDPLARSRVAAPDPFRASSCTPRPVHPWNPAATEGGPGYLVTGSREDRPRAVPTLLSNWYVLIDGQSGTGGSGAVDRVALETAEKWTVELLGAGGEFLGPRASLYSTGSMPRMIWPLSWSLWFGS